MTKEVQRAELTENNKEFDISRQTSPMWDLGIRYHPCLHIHDPGLLT